MLGSTATCRPAASSSSPQVRSAPRSASKPRDVVHLEPLLRARPVVDDGDGTELAAGVFDGLQFAEELHGHGRGEQLADRSFMGAEDIAAMDERHRCRTVAQGERPVDRAVAAADDEDAPAAEGVEVAHEVVDAGAARFGTGDAELLRGEGPDAGGDDDGAAA
ncbi:MAG: hypothetical protein NZ761_01670, partial [Dehalococcoidia bacterium]|nr:hypothetical protein [Dehalococcoidia bacterium]